ncbi:bifunctional helix-turn-helix transcriptional regulator/GNAT family N-acetyltransferase [Phytoactinopolyspora mesophila]|uniref:GNAT family N-acetyltransferase n=1 Tax=Phytoactinopolyspora mesophila TaxID=2650750 RepID=A0A7K3LXM0_9ACTN|nr:helix-turn-helix domain-containing GNAT family N-acetyltransferase [Phytoactinopolyspora mesophila]NDL55774.1 GNAT family N-acetyltransferase [Phytoactinopolyspora mesophila]
MTGAAIEQRTVGTRVSAVRRFNRFFTAHMGLLDQGLLQSRFSVTEARVIFELAQHDGLAEITAVRAAMHIDPGHLSRVLGRLEKKGLVERSVSELDARKQVASLTATGRDAFATLNARSEQQAARLLEQLSNDDQRHLVNAFETAERLLSARPAPRTIVIRGLRPGDLGWVVQRHGRLYADEYGWGQAFEALVAQIVADYGRDHDPAREQAWIAEVDGKPAGCVFCVRKNDHTAQLRLLLVEPWARGDGVGGRLVDECVRFARSARYKSLVLWTNDVLTAARHLYIKTGFRLVEEEPHRSFGHDLVGQYWELRL